MLLTWSTAAMGLIGFVVQIIAHVLMWEDGSPERTPIARYAVGVGIIGLCLSIGLTLDSLQDPIAAFWYNALLSGAAAGVCYEIRRRYPPKAPELPPISRDNLDMWADAIAGEHDDEAKSSDQH